MGFHDVCVNVGLRQILSACIIDWHASQVQPHASLYKCVHDLCLSLMAYCIRSSSFIPMSDIYFGCNISWSYVPSNAGEDNHVMLMLVGIKQVVFVMNKI